MTLFAQPRIIGALRRYFASGWAFLIPYQLAYLLYYWRQWPSNPGTETAAKTFIPSLLVVYWAMHALHVGLALLASASPKREEGKVNGENVEPTPAPRIRRLLSLFTLHSSLFPWIVLTLLFYIPGVYLEFPSDPLMHLRRITEWQMHEVVHWHTAGYKSLYFFAYSLIGWLPPGRLLFWTNLYHVAICLLLSWQYYRLARDAGLPKRWAQGFVLLHALLFGNFCFSFFRYYSLASTAFSQLGAIVLIRLTITWVKQKSEERRVKGEKTVPSNDQGRALHRHQLRAMSSELLATVLRPLVHSAHLTIRSFLGSPSALCLLSPFTFHFSLFVSALCAALLVANNHVQGLGIAALGCASVIAWKIVRWPRHPWKGWLILTTLLTTGSLAVYYGWPRSPKFETVAMEPHWLTSWQGLNFFPPDGTAYPRSIAIIGMIGVLNLLAGMYLCLRRKLAGWLTLGPMLLLAIPCAGVPAADMFARIDKGLIIFPRMLFSIPAGLAIMDLARDVIIRAHKIRRAPPPAVPTRDGQRLALHASPLALSSLLALLFLLTGLPASHPWQNHFWHALARPPSDLSFIQESVELAQLIPAPRHPSPITLFSSSARPSSSRPPRIGSTAPVSRLLQLEHPLNIPLWTAPKDNFWFLHYGHYSGFLRAPSDDYVDVIWPAFAKHPYPELLTIPPTRLYTPYSQAAQSSVHWNAADALFATTGMPELEALAQTKGLTPKRLPSGMTLWEPREE